MMKLGLREIFFLTLIFSAIGAGYVFVFEPAAIERGDLRADIRMKTRALADLAIATGSAKDLDRKAARIHREIEQFTHKLPQEQSANEIARALSRAAARDNLAIEAVKPLKFQSLGVYSQQPVRLKLTGDCAALYQFLQQTERSPGPARITQMSLHKASLDGEVTADLTICVYFAPTVAGAPRLPQTVSTE